MKTDKSCRLESDNMLKELGFIEEELPGEEELIVYRRYEEKSIRAIAMDRDVSFISAYIQKGNNSIEPTGLTRNELLIFAQMIVEITEANNENLGGAQVWT